MNVASRLIVVLAFGLASCGGAKPTENGSNSSAPPAQAAPPPPAQATAASCGDGLAASADDESFVAAGIGASAADKARWTREGADAFKAAAAALCGSKKLDPAELAPKRRLLIQYGGGADSAAVYEPEDNGRETIILQYAYWPGAAGPSKEDVSGAIQCWSDPQLDMCAEREP